jgi:squalene synthase HpnC
MPAEPQPTREGRNARADQIMTTSADVASGKSHGDENFPVASRLIAARHRPAIMAFYDFVRAADDVADSATLTPGQKLDLLDGMEDSLLGRTDHEAVALPLRFVLAERRLSPRHAQDLLAAFRLDVTKNRTASWAELIHYCSLSAMPVGRYVLDVHGEAESTWPASDAICAALQIINHLQDCGKDYRDLDRVYIPLDSLARAGLGVEALAEPKASPALLGVFRDLAERTDGLLDDGAILPRAIRDLRLGMEIATVAALARRLTGILKTHDPLSQRVHLGKPAMLGTALLGCLALAGQRLIRRPVVDGPRPRGVRP